MKRIIALSLAATVMAAPLAAAAQTRTVTAAEKQRLIDEAKAENQRLAEREKEFYASQERLQAQLKEARASGNTARVTELQTLVARNEAQRERQRAANADRQRRIQAIYALQVRD
ncbi:hypothetical protein [Sphingomonas adhaesiva]|uniref:hypothetical protein n=1 Tax=Sphingomonas adhaesiva TaxID=28212 RepID=UPI002FF6EA56